MTIHSTFPKGQKVLIIFKDGTQLVDRFVEKKSGVILFEDSGRIKIEDVRSTTVYKDRNP